MAILNARYKPAIPDKIIKPVLPSVPDKKVSPGVDYSKYQQVKTPAKPGLGLGRRGGIGVGKTGSRDMIARKRAYIRQMMAEKQKARTEVGKKKLY